MATPTLRPGALTPARVVALALIGLAALGLAWLRFAGNAHAVSVPKGAHAGDLILERSGYETEDGRYTADVGTFVVPENRADPRSRLIALPVTRIHARSAHPGPPIFRLEGGPGISNMLFPQASRFAANHDVVLVGYRGVDGSVRLDCPEVESALARSSDLLADASSRKRADAFRACADRLQDDGTDLAGYTLPQRVDDLEAARRALGYGRVDLLSESAGTRTAMIWAWRHPSSIHRSVMLGVNPPGHFLWDARTTGEQLRRYAALCARDASCRRRTSDLAASLHAATGSIPKHWWFLPVREGNVRAGAFFGLMHATTDGGGPLAAPLTIDTLLGGEGGGAWLLSTLARVAFPKAQVWGDVAAVGRSDAAAATRFFARHADRGSVFGAPGTDLVWAGGRLVDAWPATPDDDAYARVRDSKVQTLLVGGSLDLATPPQWATRDLLPHLLNGREVVLPGFGHTGDFWTNQRGAGTHLVTTFLDTGRVDRSRYTPAEIDLTPVLGYDGIAAIVLGVLLGTVALAALLLLWLALRVRWRGAYGRTGSAVVRSVVAVVLGLAGWFAAALVLLTALPGVPLDDARLAVLSVGVPVGLGVTLGWARPGRSAGARAAGLVAALLGALAGAWLGLHAVADLLGVATAVLGAVAGVNLALIALDVWLALSVRRRATRADADLRRTEAVRAT
jgi:pimeloyl-ACP methyl ester carboxylesterase